jgi:hypothetical protein
MARHKENQVRRKPSHSARDPRGGWLAGGRIQ